MVRCIDCGICAFYVDLGKGLTWHEMDHPTRHAFLQNQQYDPPGQNPGTGNWDRLACAKYLHEWAEWNDGAPSVDALREALTKERDCDGFDKYAAGYTPQHTTFTQSVVLEEVKYDIFLSHSSLDDDLCKDITGLLENSGLRVFATPTSIPTGKWEEQIEDALKNASTVWVLLTPNAMSQSVWTHHEFGYFYGFRHGRDIDHQGHNCRFLYSDPSHLKGLYDHIMGSLVTSFEDPVYLAQVIAAKHGKALSIPPKWVPRRYPAPPQTQTPWIVRAGGPEFRLNPGFKRELVLDCSFKITAQTQPGGGRVSVAWCRHGYGMGNTHAG
ncbi:MAG: toll/interleukin-1 receptor domain-containing protein [Chloroflexi bacterium]|nr:toll/interleukin-1 receptor domain-containing protein [Chloroflexota bacterium]